MIAKADSAPAVDAIEEMRMGHRAVEEFKIRPDKPITLSSPCDLASEAFGSETLSEGG